MFAYIPARSGSKRIKNKNIKFINGKPVISYVIQNLKKLKFVNEIYVSTDSIKIQKIVKKLGATCDFLRSKKLSNDKASFNDLIKEDLPKFIRLQNEDKNILFVLPTAALVSKKIYSKGYNYFKKKKPDVLMSCKKFDTTPYWSLFMNKSGYLNSLFPKMVLKNSQELNSLYYDAGLFYFFNHDNIKKFNDIKNAKKIFPFFVNNEDSGIDIDTLDDWKRFKEIFNKNFQKVK